MHTAIAVCSVFGGCCSNVVFLELLIKENAGSGNIITFAQFLFISLDGFIFTSKLGTIKPIIPIKNYLILVILFFLVNVVNNYALNFNIAMPLHMIFRAGSLIANLILGMIILKKRYKWSKYCSVVMITAGITICMLASAKSLTSEENVGKTELYDIVIWCIGIAMLTFALLMSSWMGIFQETLYNKYGKHPREALFYCHVLALPGFLFLSKDIYNQAIQFSLSDLYNIPFLEIGIPKMWLHLLGNVFTQFICIQSVFILTTECSSLTVNLVITLRKFLSLLFSIFYFKNAFTWWHWFGTILVFTGTFVFIDILKMIVDIKKQYFKVKTT